MRHLRAAILILLAFVSLSSRAHAREDLATVGQQISERFPHILVDVRGSRGGNGDVAAAYLTVADWLQNYHVKSEITFLIDANGKNRLEKLSASDELFRAAVRVREATDGEIKKPQDLYLVLASPSGTYRYAKDFGSLIHLAPHATLMVQTVLGNTENQKSLHASATVETDGRVFDWGAAGLGQRESGVYTDVEAQRFRSQTRDELRAWIIAHAKTIEDEFSRQAISRVVNGQALQGAKTGLVYGISAPATKPQFMSYLRGLAALRDQSFVLITPSAFRAPDVTDEALKDKIIFLNSVDSLPANAEKGKIYLIETKTLPHPIFVSLMALSQRNGVVPLGAGDGFLSAAIELGAPFALTQVDWNRANIQKINELLLAQALSSDMGGADLINLRRLLNSVYGVIDFTRVSELNRFQFLYHRLHSVVPSLSKRIFDVALAARDFKDRGKNPKVADATLQMSVLSGGRKAEDKSKAKAQASAVQCSMVSRDFMRDFARDFSRD